MADDVWLFAKQLAGLYDAPHLELRVQEGDHWDFTLTHRSKVIADFSTRVSYFDDDPALSKPWKQGNAEAFAKCWGLTLESVAPYLIDWDTLPAPKLAADGDKYLAGDWCQIFDFMRAIGVEDPLGHADHFEFDALVWQSTYAPQPRWRKVVRRISVWIKGTYPDVPRRGRAERNRWRKLTSKIRIVKVEASDSNEHE